MPAMRVTYSASVDIKPEWKVVEEVQFGPTLQKLAYNPGDAKEEFQCGTVEFFDKAFDSVSARSDVSLKRTSRRVPARLPTGNPCLVLAASPPAC